MPTTFPCCRAPTKSPARRAMTNGRRAPSAIRATSASFRKRPGPPIRSCRKAAISTEFKAMPRVSAGVTADTRGMALNSVEIAAFRHDLMGGPGLFLKEADVARMALGALLPLVIARRAGDFVGARQHGKVVGIGGEGGEHRRQVVDA